MDETPIIRPRDISFDARLKYNDMIGEAMLAIIMNRAAGNHDAWYRTLFALVDTVPYIDKTELSTLDDDLNKARTLLLTINSSNARDPAVNAAKRSKTYELEMVLSHATRQLFKFMADHKMLLPLKMNNDEFDEKDVAEGMGLW